MTGPRAHRAVPPPPPAVEPAVEPPFYEATEDLYVGYPESGSMPMIAYHKGDRVVPDVIEPNGWGGKVRVPAAFEGQLSPAPAPADASEPGTESDPAPATPTEKE